MRSDDWRRRGAEVYPVRWILMKWDLLHTYYIAGLHIVHARLSTIVDNALNQGIVTRLIP